MLGYPVRTDRSLILAIIVFSFFYSLFSAASVSILMPFVNVIFAGYDLQAFFAWPQVMLSDKYTALITLCIVTWTFFLLKNVFFVAAQNRLSVFRNDLLQRLREDQLDRTLGQDLAYFHSIPSGLVVTRMFETARIFAEKSSLGLYDIARTVPLILMYAAILFAISWKLMLLSLCFVPLISLAGNLYHKRLSRSLAEEEEAMGRLIHQLQQKIYGIKLVKLFHAQEYERKDFHQRNGRLNGLVSSRERLESAGLALIEMIGVSAGVALLYVIGIETLDGLFVWGPGGFVLFIAAVFSLIDPVRSLIRSFHLLREARMLHESLQEPPRVKPRPFLHSADRFHERIEFVDVTFGFPGHAEPVFQGLRWTIRKGERIALTGHSGIGKSTLIDLLLGLYQPDSGWVRMDGKPVSEIDPNDLARIFGVATQEAFVFQDTIRNNLIYNSPDLTDDVVRRALEQVGLAEWLRRGSQGLDTVIGERGQTMSGGEKQRLVLARMILRDPDILIFDEATSALDLPSEKEIFELILKLFPEKTLILISHRPTLQTLAKRIVEVGYGNVHERSVPSTFS